jgi:aspartyl-tRNA(Asn)/glutamyl-tRNA(Gln) amidotransferase subunit C
MSLTPTDIDRIANLARLELSLPKASACSASINGFFDIVEQMRAVDTTGIEPLAHPVACDPGHGPAPARRRGQRAQPARSQPAQRTGRGAGLFLVPKVIE